MHLLAGASGYSYKPWKGPFYPADLPDADMLAYYAARLPAVEINNTFYRLPKSEVLEGWAEKTPAGFRFAMKASRKITHIQRLKDVGETLDYLFETVAVLGARQGPILFQLPPYSRKDFGRLEGFLELVPPTRKIALEFRHRSWFEDDVFDLLRAHGAALCIAESEGEDTPDAPFVATGGFGYLRLRRDDYTDADLEKWADRIRREPWSEAYVFFKHEDEGAAPRLAQRLMQIMGA